MISKVSRYYYSLQELANVNGPNVPSSDPDSFPALINHIIPLWTTGFWPWEVGAVAEFEKTWYKSYLWPEFYEAPVLAIDVECAPWEEPQEPSAAEVSTAVKPLLGRLYRWYNESLERYKALIPALEEVKTHLMGPVNVSTNGESSHQEINAGSGSNTGTVKVDSAVSSSGSTTNLNKHLENDVPQVVTGGSTFDDGYANKAVKDDGYTTNTNATDTDSTTTNNLVNTTSNSAEGSATQSNVVASDVDTPIERFNEVRQKLRSLYADWADEFARFVIQSAE